MLSQGKCIFIPNMHEHVAEETPHLGSVAGMVNQWAFHEVRLICLQNPLVEHDAVTHEHNNLQHKRGGKKSKRWCRKQKLLYCFFCIPQLILSSCRDNCCLWWLIVSKIKTKLNYYHYLCDYRPFSTTGGTMRAIPFCTNKWMWIQLKSQRFMTLFDFFFFLPPNLKSPQMQPLRFSKHVGIFVLPFKSEHNRSINATVVGKLFADLVSEASMWTERLSLKEWH